MNLKMAYLRAHHWKSEGEALGSEEGMVLDTCEVLGSTIGSADKVKIGLDYGTELVYLVVFLEGYNFSIPKCALLGDQIEEAIYGA